MHMKNTQNWKRRIALLIAALMIFAVIPAALAVVPEWNALEISVSWTAGEETPEPSRAAALPEKEGSFWVLVPQDAFYSAMYLNIAIPCIPNGNTGTGPIR